MIKSRIQRNPTKLRLRVEGADELYREIRIDNALQDEKGKEVALKVGTEIEVTIEAPADGPTVKENISDKG